MHKTKATPEPANDDARFPGRYTSADERRGAGKTLRDAAPRAAHGGWKPPNDRRDPIELLHESNESRIPELIPIRFGRMSQSPFAFYRGSAAVMAADLASTPASGLRVQACGDAHLMNFGGFATPERNIFFDINDFDETLPAPWEWDVKRLAASIVICRPSYQLARQRRGEGGDGRRVLLPRTNDRLCFDARARRLVRSHRSGPRSEGPADQRRGSARQAKSRTGSPEEPAGKLVSPSWSGITAPRRGSRTNRR